MEYLTVKDVAALVRRNEETIRRMIRARKLDVTLDNNNRKQGYMISVDQLTRTWDISREEVERYIQERRAQEAGQSETRQPLGPERETDDMTARIGQTVDAVRDWSESVSMSVARTLEESARRIAKEIDKAAQRVDSLRGDTAKAEYTDAAGEARRSDDHRKGAKRAGEMQGMCDDWNKWVDSDEKSGKASQWNSTARNVNENVNVNGTQRSGADDFSADFSAAGERVGEIINDAYRQIRRAVEQASSAYSTTRDQNDSAARRSEYAHVYQRQQNAEDAARSDEAKAYAADCNSDTYEMARRAYKQRQDSIRDAIMRSTGAAPVNQTAADQTAPDTEAPKATGGWAETIKPIRKPEEQPEKKRKTPAQQTSPETETQPQASHDYSWSHAQPTPSPIFDEFKGRQPDFSVDIPKVSPHGVDAPEENLSYQMLQAARKAVQERLQTARDKAAQTSVTAISTEQAAAAPDAPETAEQPTKPQSAVELAKQEIPEQPVEDLAEDKIAAAEKAARSLADNIIQLSAATGVPATDAADVQCAAACGNESAEPAQQPKNPEQLENPEHPVQLPTDDEDVMQSRMDSLETKLSKLSSQLELLTRKLLGEDDK